MPAPTTPQFTAPANNATVSGNVLLQWTASTIPDEEPPSDTTAPVFANGNVPSAGTTVVINLTESGTPPILPASGVTGWTVSVNGSNRSITNAVRSGNTQITLTVASAIQSGDTVTVSYSPGNVTDSASPANAMAATSNRSITNNSTQGGGGGSYSPTVEAYITSVDAKRTALSQSALTTGAKDALEEFWQRIGNRDAELSGNLQSVLKDLVLLNQTHNVGAGEEVVSLKGHVYTRAGGTSPSWGANSMTFAGGTSRLEASGAVIDTDDVAVMVVGRATGSGSRYIYTQYDNNSNDATPYNWGFYTRTTNNTGFVFKVPAAEGDLFSRWENGGSMNVSAPNWSVQAGSVGYPLTDVPVVVHGFPECTAYTQAAVDSRVSQTFVDNDVATAIGAMQGSQGSGFTGELAIILSFGSYIVSESEWDAIYNIVAETVGAPLSLPTA